MSLILQTTRRVLNIAKSSARGPIGPTGLGTNVSAVGTRAQAMRTTITALVGDADRLVTTGYATSGDGGDGKHLRRAAQPAHPAWFQTKDGAYWELDESRVRIEMFGGGVGKSAAVNGAALRAMNRYARIRGGRLTVDFLNSNAPYATDEGRWTWGIRDLEIHLAAGVSVQNLGTGASTTDRVPFVLNAGFMTDNLGTPDAPVWAANTGYPIQSAGAAATSVTIVNTANMKADELFPGAPLLLHGWNLGISGSPPAMRNFVFRRVRDVNFSTGVVSLDVPLGIELRADWLDIDAGAKTSIGEVALGAVGKARILPLSRGSRYQVIERCVISGGVALQSNTDGISTPGVTSLRGSLYSTGCIQFEMTNMSIGGYFYPTECAVIRCGHNRYYNVEVDKMLDHYRDEGSSFGAFSNGPGCNLIHLIRPTFLRPTGTLSARNTLIESPVYRTGNGRQVPSFTATAETQVSQLAGLSISPGVESVTILDPLIDTRDDRAMIGALPDQTGVATTQVKLPATASTTDGIYNGCEIEVFDQTGKGQARAITAYAGATQLATIGSAWTTAPVAGSRVRIDRVLPFLSSGTNYSLTVAGVTAEGWLQVALTGGGKDDVAWKSVQPGSILTSGTKSFKATGLVYDGTYTIVQGTWTGAAPAAGDVFTGRLTKSVVIRGMKLIGTQPRYRNISGQPASILFANTAQGKIADEVTIETDDMGRSRIRIPFLFFRDLTRGGNTLSYLIGGRSILSVLVAVTTAYAGTATSANLTIGRLSSEGAAPFSMLVNLKVAGVRRIDVAGAIGAQTGDNLGALVIALANILTMTCNTDLSDAPPEGFVILETA